jgi:glutamine amidotransferase-like uncharacterized protein
VRPKIALFVHHPECSRQCAAGIVKALSPKYDFKIFTEHDVSPEFFYDVDCVAFPGGIGDADKYHEFFTRRKGNVIADFIAQGGHYLGICMGAYWAGSHYFDLLDGCDAVQYIKRPNTDIRRSYGTYAPIIWERKYYDMYFYDGCAIVGDRSKFKTVATYSNCDPMAIIQGRIGIIGCHPESQEFWYDKPYLKDHWHNEQHHPLLLQFVDQLIGQKNNLMHFGQNPPILLPKNY